MEFLMWIALILRVLKRALPWLLGLGLAVLVVSLVGALPKGYVLPVFVGVAVLAGAFLKKELFKERKPPYPPVPRRRPTTGWRNYRRY